MNFIMKNYLLLNINPAIVVKVLSTSIKQQILLKVIVISTSISIRQILPQQYWMEVMK